MKIRLYLENDLTTCDEITLDKKQSHYLKNVLRCKISDPIFIFDDKSGEYQTEIKDIKTDITLKICTKTKEYKTPKQIYLHFAPVKNVKSEFIAQKAVELNIFAIQPILTARTIVRKIKLEKIKANMIEAAEQTDSVYLPILADLTDLTKLLKQIPEQDLIIFCDETGKGKIAKELFKNLNLTTQQKAHILIGPEGGFSDAEHKLISAQKNCLNLSLGTNILRADTAIISALSLCNNFLDNLG